MTATYYSDNGVDRMVEQHLPILGVACDVGANDGVLHSNTLHFEEQGWVVLCIEPNPLLADQGRSNRRLWLEMACADKEAEMEFESRGGGTHASGSSLGLRPAYHDSPGVTSRHAVKVRRLDDILEGAGFHRLDYLTIDVEGWENEVLDGFTIERWKPKIIVCESRYDDLKTPEGYERIGRATFDNIYMRRSNGV